MIVFYSIFDPSRPNELKLYGLIRMRVWLGIFVWVCSPTLVFNNLMGMCERERRWLCTRFLLGLSSFFLSLFLNRQLLFVLAYFLQCTHTEKRTSLIIVRGQVWIQSGSPKMQFLGENQPRMNFSESNRAIWGHFRVNKCQFGSFWGSKNVIILQWFLFSKPSFTWTVSFFIVKHSRL